MSRSSMERVQSAENDIFESIEGVNQAWLSETMRACQQFIDSLAQPYNHPEQLFIDSLIQGISRPQCRLESTLLRSLLFEAAIRWMELYHSIYHGFQTTDCSFVIECSIPSSTNFGGLTSSFTQSLEHFLERISNTHPEPLPFRVAGLAEAHLQVSSKLVRTEMKTTRPRAKASFEKAFTCSLNTYVAGLRIRRAYDLLTQTDLKVEAVAGELGFRSKKNFYRMVRSETGMTPDQLRRSGRAGHVPRTVSPLDLSTGVSSALSLRCGPRLAEQRIQLITLP